MKPRKDSSGSDDQFHSLEPEQSAGNDAANSDSYEQIKIPPLVLSRDQLCARAKQFLQLAERNWLSSRNKEDRYTWAVRAIQSILEGNNVQLREETREDPHILCNKIIEIATQLSEQEKKILDDSLSYMQSGLATIPSDLMMKVLIVRDQLTSDLNTQLFTLKKPQKLGD